MKILRKCISILMTAAFAIGMAGCSAAASVPEDFVNTAKSYGIEEVKKSTDVTRITARMNSEGSGYYIAKDGDEAKKYYRSLMFSNARKLPDCDVEDFRIIAVNEPGEKKVHQARAYTFKFYSKEDAQEVFDIYTENVKRMSRKVEAKEGKEKNYSYVLNYGKGLAGATLYGLYVEGKSVTYMQATFYFGDHEYNDFADHFCKKMGYVSPMSMYEN